jgi:hypothetical protein
MTEFLNLPSSGILCWDHGPSSEELQMVDEVQPSEPFRIYLNMFITEYLYKLTNH